MKLTVESDKVAPDALVFLADELKANGIPSLLSANGIKTSRLNGSIAFASFHVSIATEEGLRVLSSVLAKRSESVPFKIELNGVECPAGGQDAIRKAIQMALYSSFDEVAPRGELTLSEHDLLEIERGGHTLDSLLDSIFTPR